MFWILDSNHQPFKLYDTPKETEVSQWLRWVKDNKDARVIRQDKISGVFISTIFAGYALGSNREYTETDKDFKPKLYETRIFSEFEPKNSNLLVTRSKTKEDALIMHESAIERVNDDISRIKALGYCHVEMIPKRGLYGLIQLWTKTAICCYLDKTGKNWQQLIFCNNTRDALRELDKLKRKRTLQTFPVKTEIRVSNAGEI